jgi:acyl carrier protein
MTPNDAMAAVRSCLQDALKLTTAEAGTVTPATTPQQFPAWTSMAHLELMLALEKHFDIMFEAEEIGSLASVSAILAAVEKHRAR